MWVCARSKRCRCKCSGFRPLCHRDRDCVLSTVLGRNELHRRGCHSPASNVFTYVNLCTCLAGKVFSELISAVKVAEIPTVKRPVNRIRAYDPVTGSGFAIFHAEPFQSKGSSFVEMLRDGPGDQAGNWSSLTRRVERRKSNLRQPSTQHVQERRRPDNRSHLFPAFSVVGSVDGLRNRRS